MTNIDKIRNFSIIAHIDHGKSTLADRLIQATGGLSAREMSAQVLDNMDIERERGITIKAQTVRLEWKGYELNLMDTPGHVDFAYEVSRSLAACEGALLVVDAAQGVEAQTLANVYQSIEHDHEIVPVINKIDLPAADPEGVRQEIEEIIGLDASGAVLASAKTGVGIEEVLQAIVDTIPPPTGDASAPTKAMLVDSWYDPYLGVVILVRVIDGSLKKGQQVRFMAAGTTHLIDRVGCFRPKIEQLNELGPGEIGFITAQIKEVAETRVGDTITDAKRPAATPLPGFKLVQPVVFCGLFPVDANDFEKLRDSLYKLRLNDASFRFEMATSAALGFGCRRGYASFDNHQIGHRPGDLVKMSILVNAEPVDALSMIVERANAEARGRGMCERLKDLIPRHLFKIPNQAAIGGKIIARETIAALRKDVTAKCYGGDATRKRKLLEKQKKGKARMREYGNVSIPQEAFIAALRMGDDA